jgi:membrane-associated phospholipid phosphatase
MTNGRGWAAIGGFIALVAVYGVVNRLTIAHIVLLGLIAGAIAMRKSRWVGMAFVPVSMFILAYDLLRVFAERAIRIVTIEPVYALELAIFGIEADGGALITPNEWIVDYLNTPLDLFGGVVYATHIVPLLLVGPWILWRSRALDKGDRRLIGGFFWGLFALNIIAYGTMLAFPVAPPWYVEAYGMAPPAEVVIGNPGRLARVDAWMGNDYFTSVYAQGAYTFGAVPSLHCAYPVYAALFLGKNRWAALAWFWVAAMSFYAVYLNHHYIVDLIAGAGLAAGMWALVRFTPVGEVARRIYEWQLSLFPVESEQRNG